MHHNGGFNTVQRTAGLLLVFCAFMIIPLSLGVVVLNQINNSGKNVSALTPTAPNKCDLNHDGQVTQADLEVAAASFGKVTTEAGKLADIDGNGWVNSLDMLIISKNDPVRCQGVSGSPTPKPPVTSPTPSPTTTGCTVVPGVIVQSGAPIIVSHKGFAAGESIKLLGNTLSVRELAKTVDSTAGTKQQTLQLPSGLAPGIYNVNIVTRFPIVTFPCGKFEISPVASCTLTQPTVKAGGLVGVKSSSAQVAGPIVLSGPKVYNLNDFLRGGSVVNFTVPADAPAGTYKVLIGGTAYVCKTLTGGDLVVTRSDVVVQ